MKTRNQAQLIIDVTVQADPSYNTNLFIQIPSSATYESIALIDKDNNHSILSCPETSIGRVDNCSKVDVKTKFVSEKLLVLFLPT